MFELLQTLDVGFEKLPPRARPGRRKGVGGLDENRLDRRKIDVAVMGGDGLDHLLRLAVLLASSTLNSVCVPSTSLSTALPMSWRSPALRATWTLTPNWRAIGREEGHFLGVLEDVLAVTRPVLELAEKLDELGMQILNFELEDGRLAFLLDLLIELLFDRFDDFLDPGRMDPAVMTSFSMDSRASSRRTGSKLERMTASGVSSTMISTPSPLQGPDVPALAADDPALHVVGGQVDDRDRGLDDMLGGRALDGVADDLLGLDPAGFPGLILDPAHDLDGLEPGLVLDLA
jgi:hypothetical protein